MQLLTRDTGRFSQIISYGFMNVSVIVSVLAAAHLGFVNGAVQCIVLLVIQQTEVQGPQRSC